MLRLFLLELQCVLLECYDGVNLEKLVVGDHSSVGSAASSSSSLLPESQRALRSYARGN